MKETVRYFRQLKAFTWTSFLTQIRNPSAIMFGFIFPIVFMLFFGYINTSQNTDVNIGVLQDNTLAYQEFRNLIKNNNLYSFTTSLNEEDLQNELLNGDLDAYIKIKNIEIEEEEEVDPRDLIPRLNPEGVPISEKPPYQGKIIITYNANREQTKARIIETLEKINIEAALEIREVDTLPFSIEEEKELDAREVEYIDFIIPGILGYSIMSTAVFGVAYSFLNLRKNATLKRLFATPSNVGAFLFGQSLARFGFIVLQVAGLLATSMIAFSYNPINGYSSLLQMMVIVSLASITFLGFGYFVAGIAKNNELVSALTNIIVFPQFALSGTFFDVENLPSWLGSIAKFTPLYHFNESMRYISLEGLNLWNIEVITQIGFLLIWTIAIYAISSRVFKITSFQK